MVWNNSLKPRHVKNRLVLSAPSQLNEAVGVCYLRLWLTMKETDEVALLAESIDVSVEP